MKICENDVIRKMTAEEEAQYNEIAARAAAEAKHRPITESEVLNRDTGSPVYNKLSELVGIYVEVTEI